MRLWMLSVILSGVVGQIVVLAAEVERVPFTENVATVIAVDGVLIASRTDAFPYSLRIVGADPSTLSHEHGLIQVGWNNHTFRNTTVWVRDLGMKAPGGDREKLKAHLAWEVEDLNRISQQKLTATAEFLQVNGHTWAHWTYDISPFANDDDVKRPSAPGRAQVMTQHYLTTVVGDYIVVIVTSDRSGPKDRAALDMLKAIANTMIVHPWALTPAEMAALARKPQQ